MKSFLARDFAFNKGKRKLDYCVLHSKRTSNYGDVRTLKARTLAWDGDYPKGKQSY
jgi:hypothetical protein